MCFVLTANCDWAFSTAADQTVRVKARRDLLLGQSCIDAICHQINARQSRLLHPAPPPTGSGHQSWRISQTVGAFFFFLTQQPTPLLHSLLSPAAYHNPPIFSPIHSPIPLKHMSTMPIYSTHSSKSTGATQS